jgi:DNA-binding response OmpR family regulator
MKKVLVIEDQPEIRELIRMALEFEPLDIHEADNGPAGLAAAHRLRPDLLLLDVMMPGGLDGFALCAQVRADAELKKTPIVMLTARSQASDRRRGLEVGANAFLTKPFSAVQLLATVGRLV